MNKVGTYSISSLLIATMFLSLCIPLVGLAEKVESFTTRATTCCCSQAAEGEKCCDCIPLEDDGEATSCAAGMDDFCHVGQVGGNAHLVLLLGYLPIDFSLNVENGFSINHLNQIDNFAFGFINLLERPPKPISIV